MEFNLKQRLIHHLMLNSGFCKELGLLEGKMGIAITFYLLSKETDNNTYECFAGDLLDEVLNKLNKRMPIGLKSGLSGIGWGVEYLIQNNFVEADSSDICIEINRSIMLSDIRRVSDDSFETGLQGLLHYILMHIKGCKIQKSKCPFDQTYLIELYHKIKSINNTDNEGMFCNVSTQYIEFIEKGIFEYVGEIDIAKNSLAEFDIKKIESYPLGLSNGLSSIIIN
ncbi:lanthionine synthetase LanC family protein [Dysgonomonas sp. ZJ279]|uniref:lanthionine synthetase LanC family protein n=1 Tax=Dysgonomonas sp. ZJ279 TaxID=2709796 RepID=UPI0013E99ECA|nr:lanthionine synthetase LanC family protein [Dysgonomonas sp. ZJ279]